MEVKLYDHRVCDFCSSADPHWHYPAETFNANPGEPLPQISEGDWLACHECAALIQCNEWSKLARRGLLTPLAKELLEVAPEDYVLGEIQRLHKGFREHRRGRVAWETT